MKSLKELLENEVVAISKMPPGVDRAVRIDDLKTLAEVNSKLEATTVAKARVASDTATKVAQALVVGGCTALAIIADHNGWFPSRLALNVIPKVGLTK